MNDSIDDFFEREREAVPFLAPPAGRFEELQTVARRRRNRNTTAVSAVAAVVLAVVGTGAVLGAQNWGGSQSVSPAASPTAAKSTGVPTAAPNGVNTPPPSGFQAWSVSFVSSGHGYALGGYPCNGQSCFAVLETTDAMTSWHTIAEPGFSAEYGMGAANAILRFSAQGSNGVGSNGWMVGSQGVWSTHDSGRHWAPIGKLQDQQIDSLEAAGTHTYAIGRGGDTLWVSASPDGDSWTAQDNIGLATTDPAATDVLAVDDRMVAVTRTLGQSSTVRLSGNNGSTWRPVPSPCKGHDTAPAVFSLVDEHISRFICGDGTVMGIRFGNKQPVRDGQFDLSVTSGAPVKANSVSTSPIGTMVAYSGAGIWGYLANKTVTNTLKADVGYVGLTNSRQGIALPATPSGSYWVTTSGGLAWQQKSWN